MSVCKWIGNVIIIIVEVTYFVLELFEFLLFSLLK